jgi:hypothetical protein
VSRSRPPGDVGAIIMASVLPSVSAQDDGMP